MEEISQQPVYIVNILLIFTGGRMDRFSKFIAILIVFSSLASIPSTAGAEEITQAGNHFAFNLLSHIVEQNGQNNIFFSPLSIDMALTITFNGADGETRDAMARVLELNGFKLPDINEYNHRLLERLESDHSNSRLNIANSIWIEKSFPVNKDFTDTVASNYNSEIVNLPFDQAAVNRINQWVSDRTNARIKHMIDRLDPDAAMVLLNAIYFKGQWKYEFTKRLSMIRDFYLINGDTTPIPMMTQTEKFMYAESDGVQVVELPYSGDDLSMLILLPDKDKPYDEFTRIITAQKINDLKNQLSLLKGTVTIPKIELDYELNLNDVLKSMGMGIAFEPKANFRKMIQPGQSGLYIGDVLHKAFVKINEEGTEAAASTAVIMMKATSFNPEETFTFTADHPYLFIIQDNASGTILFMGSITNPK